MRRFIFPEDPMMEAITWIALGIFAMGFLFGFGVGVCVCLMF